MTALRSAHVPLDHLVAELIAFPLSSIEAFNQGTVSLSPRLHEHESTRDLWRAAEQDLLNRMPAVSVDELVHLRDSLWFGHIDPSHSTSFPLTAYLRRIAALCLKPDGSRVVPSIPIDFRDRLPERAIPSVTARRFWRWFSMSLPPDLLISAFAPPPPCSSVTTLSSKIERFLAEEGFAETHLHIGAALDFPTYWVATLHALKHRTFRPDAMKSPGAEFEEGKHLGGWLLYAALARSLLASFLAHQQEGRFARFDEFLSDLVRVDLETRLGSRAWMNVRHVLNALLSAQADRNWVYRSFREVQRLYNHIGRIEERWPRLPSNVDEMARADPIAAVFPAQDRDGLSSEAAFCSAALSWMEKPGHNDPLFARLFWQIVRLRSIYYRHVVQRPMIPGLSWFIRFFGRIKPGRKPIENQLVPLALRLEGQFHGLRSLEFRTEPKHLAGTNIQYIEGMAKALHGLRPSPGKPEHAPELGLVLHFTRDRGGQFRQGEPNAIRIETHEDPQHESQLRRFALFYWQKRKQAFACAEMLQRWPKSLFFVRGLDICTDEQGVPTWVLAPLLRYVRDAGREASRALKEILGLNVPGLRTTVHAGEDFVHLLSGLRRIAEALAYLGLEDSDRIGHGLALGIDAQSWAKMVGVIAIPRETRLFDLLWAYRFGDDNHLPIGGDRVRYLQGEIVRLGQEIFLGGEGHRREAGEISLQNLDGFAQLLYNEEALREHGFPNRSLAIWRSELAPHSSWWLLDRYLTSSSVFHRGQEIIHIDPLHEAAELEGLQRCLRGKLARRDIAVEINPSSNLFIGNFGHLANHPLWSMAPYKQQALSEGERLAICLGSDNPLTFATTIRDEYQLVYDTLLRLGATEDERDRWIRRACRTGMRNRFTLADASKHKPRGLERHAYPVIVLPP